MRFRKRGKVRFVSHRDVARCFERAYRIVALPLAFTGGFSPRPKVSFGMGLPLGYESEAEYVDLELAEPVDLAAVVPAVNAALPEGLEVTGAAELEARAPSLQEATTSVRYLVELVAEDDPEGRPGAPPTVDVVGPLVRAVLDAEVVTGTRRHKGREIEEDLRPAVRSLAVLGPTPGGVELEVELSTQPRSVRPSEVVRVISPDLREGRVLRTHQWIERDGARWEPLDADTRSRAAVEARAS